MSKESDNLTTLQYEAAYVKFESGDYWKLRATYLEKSQDPTYSEQERTNCFSLWRILATRTK